MNTPLRECHPETVPALFGAMCAQLCIPGDLPQRFWTAIAQGQRRASKGIKDMVYLWNARPTPDPDGLLQALRAMRLAELADSLWNEGLLSRDEAYQLTEALTSAATPTEDDTDAEDQ